MADRQNLMQRELDEYAKLRREKRWAEADALRRFLEGFDNVALMAGADGVVRMYDKRERETELSLSRCTGGIYKPRPLVSFPLAESRA